MDCSTILDNTGGDWTTSFQDIQCYDQLKVNAVVNWINGKTHLGGSRAPVPVIFGMNFQAVSVGQKLIEGAINGGYTDAAGTPTASMESEIVFVDAAIGQMVTALENAAPPRSDHHHYHRQARPIANRSQPLLPHSRAIRERTANRRPQSSQPFSRRPRPPASGPPRMTSRSCG